MQEPLDWMFVTPNSIKDELINRFEELNTLEQNQIQLGTVVPQLFGSMAKFVVNPSTVSVETYKRMLDTDETIGSGIDFLNLALLARFGDYKHPLKHIQKFVRKVLESMQGSWHESLDEMFSAEWSGFSVTEQVWDYKNNFCGGPAFVPTKLVTYPAMTIVFAVDRHGEVLPDGIYQYQRFHNTSFTSYFSGARDFQLDGFRPDLYAAVGDYPYPVRISADLTYLTVQIPKDKVIHLRSSSTGKFMNPYGRSILRRAYKNWVLKDAFLSMWVVGADRKGTPLTIGFADTNSTVLQENHADGQVNRGQGRADQAMAMAFKTVHNSSFMVLPGKKGEIYDVEAIQSQGDMNVFKDGISYFNAAIMRALLVPPLVMSSGDGAGSYALADVHQKVFNKTVDGKLKPYKQAILDQFIQKILAYNFPREEWEPHGLGDFVLEEYDPEVMEKLANVYAALTNNNYMSPENQNDLDFVREKMGMRKGKIMSNMEDKNHDDDLGEDDEDDDDMPVPEEGDGDKGSKSKEEE